MVYPLSYNNCVHSYDFPIPDNTSGETPRDIPIKPEPWLPADFWEKKNMSFENSPLCDAEQQLRGGWLSVHFENK